MSRLAVLNKVSCVGLKPKVWLSAVYLHTSHPVGASVPSRGTRVDNFSGRENSLRAAAGGTVRTWSLAAPR